MASLFLVEYSSRTTSSRGEFLYRMNIVHADDVFRARSVALNNLNQHLSLLPNGTVFLPVLQKEIKLICLVEDPDLQDQLTYFFRAYLFRVSVTKDAFLDLLRRIIMQYIETCLRRNDRVRTRFGTADAEALILLLLRAPDCSAAAITYHKLSTSDRLGPTFKSLLAHVLTQVSYLYGFGEEEHDEVNVHIQ